MDFATMTAEQALDALVDLDAQKWGEWQRSHSRALNSRKSRGLLINSIVHHSLNDFGDAFGEHERKIARAQLTSDDRAELRKGG